MKSFKTYISEEIGGAAKMEQYIVIAYNGGWEKAPNKYDVTLADYEKSSVIAEKIASDIKRKTGAETGSMIHFGKGTGKMISWWEGSGVPKTDLYSTDGINISLKQKGGSQLMSGLAGETRSTFKAANIHMGKNRPEIVESLVEDLADVLKTVVVPGNINSMVAAVKTKIIPDKIIAKTASGKQKEIVIDKEVYAKKMKEFVDWKNKMKALTPKFKNFFEENFEYKTWFAYEAATGKIKFEPDTKASANWMVEFDPKGVSNDIQQLEIDGEPSPYLKKVAKKAKIRISPKTATGSKVNSAGEGSTSGSIRMTVDPDKKGTVNETIETSINEYVKYMVLNENILTEESIIQSIISWFKKVLKEIIDTLKKLAKKGLQAVLDYFGFDPGPVDTEGLELFYTV
jgi:hypothetical protein